jgi:hypothetical protein
MGVDVCQKKFWVFGERSETASEYDVSVVAALSTTGMQLLMYPQIAGWINAQLMK